MKVCKGVVRKQEYIFHILCGISFVTQKYKKKLKIHFILNFGGYNYRRKCHAKNCFILKISECTESNTVKNSIFIDVHFRTAVN